MASSFWCAFPCVDRPLTLTILTACCSVTVFLVVVLFVIIAIVWVSRRHRIADEAQPIKTVWREARAWWLGGVRAYRLRRRPLFFPMAAAVMMGRR
jgi:hypothetical protein